MRYYSPLTRKSLTEKDGKLATDDSLESYEILDDGIIDFIGCDSSSYKELSNNELYGSTELIIRYDNFLNWLFRTFKTDPAEFRKNNAIKLEINEGSKVLVTACGLGDDIGEILKIVGRSGEVYAQDLSKDMVLEARRRVQNNNVFFSISDASFLPFEDSSFDACFHFGGINLFSNIEGAINEMLRVTKPNSIVMFGDESVAPWHRRTDYGKAMIKNNLLWSAEPPLDLIPNGIKDFSLNYVLGDCFYMIKMRARKDDNDLANIDIPHIGLRGGSIRTRYYGEIEGIDPILKEKLIEYSTSNNLQVSEVIEKGILEYIVKNEE